MLLCTLSWRSRVYGLVRCKKQSIGLVMMSSDSNTSNTESASTKNNDTISTKYINHVDLPEVSKLKSWTKFSRLLTPELITLKRLFDKHNFELKIAGGAVRDLLLDIMPHDIDLASNALPQQMLDMFESEKVRVISVKGIKHGTVPVRINDKVCLS